MPFWVTGSFNPPGHQALDIETSWFRKERQDGVAGAKRRDEKKQF